MYTKPVPPSHVGVTVSADYTVEAASQYYGPVIVKPDYKPVTFLQRATISSPVI